MYMGCTFLCQNQIKPPYSGTLGKIHYTHIKSNLKSIFNCRCLWKDVHALGSIHLSLPTKQYLLNSEVSKKKMLVPICLKEDVDRCACKRQYTFVPAEKFHLLKSEVSKR